MGGGDLSYRSPYIIWPPAFMCIDHVYIVLKLIKNPPWYSYGIFALIIIYS